MAFDSEWATSELAVDRTPFDVARTVLDDDGEFSPELVLWLLANGCDATDIGRFARRSNVPTSQFLAARKSMVEAKSMTVGFVRESPPCTPPEKFPDFNGWERPQLFAPGGSSSGKAKQAWRVFRSANTPEQLFRFAGSVSWVKATSDEPGVLAKVSIDGFLFLHHALINWGFIQHGAWKECEPPAPVRKNMLADPHCPLPPLEGVRPAPVFGPGGVLTNDWGYDAPTKLFIWPRNLDIPLVPRAPTAADVAKAKHLIAEELLGDFPFDDEASKTNAIAALLHPFVRPMITGATPLHLIDKPTPGTGAGLLTEAITFPALGHAASMMSAGKLEDEWRFRLFAALLGGPAVIVIDNVNEQLKSETLTSMLTAPDTITDRVIRTSETVTVPVRNLWIANGNNVSLTKEMARRSLLIRMDANMEHPEEGREFRHLNLMEWAAEHRGELVWAALVMVQAWVAAGCHPGSKRKGSFDSWAATMSGIFETVGIPGFMENNDKLRQLADVESDAWTALVEAWLEQFGTASVGAGDLLPFAEEYLAQVVDLEGYGQAKSTKWGMTLRTKRGAVISGYKITSAGTKQRAAQWRLVRMEEAGTLGELVEPTSPGE
jgi:hypothetical protein